jgi:L-fuconolactonase
VIVDAHHHVWDPEAREHAWLKTRPTLDRPFGMADYDAVAGPEGVTASVLVQVLNSPAETEEFLALAARHAPRPAAVVGWADLTRQDLRDELDRLRGLPGGDRLAGLRHLVQDEPDAGWLTRPEVVRGLRAVGAGGLVYDLLVGPAQLPAAVRVVSELEDVRFVLDHGAKPVIGTVEPWAGLIGELALRPNVVCKLSGLVTEAGPGWKPETFGLYVDRLLACFGPGRLMFGSDWPVCTVAASYHEVMGLARSLVASQLSAAETGAVFGGNAAAAYGLRLPVPEPVQEPAEQPALAGQRRPGRRHGRPLGGDGLVVVGPGDRVHDLGFVEVLRAVDLRHVADQHAVLHDLGLQPRRAVGVPLSLAAVVQGHAHTELIHARPGQVGVDAAITQLVDDVAGPVLVHAFNVVAGRGLLSAERGLLSAEREAATAERGRYPRSGEPRSWARASSADRQPAVVSSRLASDARWVASSAAATQSLTT